MVNRIFNILDCKTDIDLMFLYSNKSTLQFAKIVNICNHLIQINDNRFNSRK